VAGNIKCVALVLTCNALGIGHCLAQVHPDPTRYQYLYMNGSFVPPYNAFPSGRDRGRWKCFDAGSKVTFDCTFVRGGFDRFQYIFRAR
jgi:hypothetical protein